MTHEELTEILSQHKLWLDAKGGERADLREANLCGAVLCGADLREANLCGAVLREANLCGANLCGADLYEANLRKANLYRADLTGADLRRAYLYGADLYGAKGVLQFGPMPTSGRIIYFVQNESAIMVQAGCFWGTIDEFKQAVKEKHNCPMYLGIIALVRQQWKPITNS